MRELVLAIVLWLYVEGTLLGLPFIVFTLRLLYALPTTPCLHRQLESTRATIAFVIFSLKRGLLKKPPTLSHARKRAVVSTLLPSSIVCTIMLHVRNGDSVVGNHSARSV